MGFLEAKKLSEGILIDTVSLIGEAGEVCG